MRTNRNAEVDRWFDGQDHPMDAAMRRAREIILGADERVTESLKWKTPTFAFEGNIASFNPSKNAVSIMFHRGSEIPGKHPKLEGDGKLVRAMRFADVREVEKGRKDLERVIKAWCDWKAGSLPEVRPASRPGALSGRLNVALHHSLPIKVSSGTGGAVGGTVVTTDGRWAGAGLGGRTSGPPVGASSLP